MPTYEYRCDDCKKTFVLIRTLSEHDNDPHPKCQHCGSRNVEQMLPSVIVQTSKKS
jgi:putative FmdB family regulatory protein